MKCPKCSSENTQLTAKKVEKKFIFPCCLTAGGIGMFILGPVGALGGIFIGVVIGGLYEVLPDIYESVMVCQSCGYVVKMDNAPNVKSHSLFCPPENSNLLIVRTVETTGSAVNFRVWIDDEPFDMPNGSRAYIKLNDGTHHLKYEQINGLGKKKRRGELTIDAQNENQIVFSFTKSGIAIHKTKS